jgi:hypothetical protein
MNPFAKPEETVPYEFEEFPKPPEEVTEYADIEGAVDYELKGLGPAETTHQDFNATPTVQPIILQDFKGILPTPQS